MNDELFQVFGSLRKLTGSLTTGMKKAAIGAFEQFRSAYSGTVLMNAV